MDLVLGKVVGASLVGDAVGKDPRVGGSWVTCTDIIKLAEAWPAQKNIPPSQPMDWLAVTQSMRIWGES